MKGPTEAERTCRRCGVRKSIEKFPLTAPRTPWRRHTCSKCCGVRVKEHYERNPDKYAAYRRGQDRRAKSARALARRMGTDTLDALRRAMVETPPPLSGDDALLAYWRGYVSGAQRAKNESERFQQYQDIAFRVAAELDGKWRNVSADRRLSYEDLVSIGYEAILEVLRKKADPPRAVVGQAIRRRIVDAVRDQAGRHGQKSLCMVSVMGEGEEETAVVDVLPAAQGVAPDDLWDEIEERCESAPDERLESILRWRGEGLTQLEIAKKLNLTESRVSQIVIANRGWLEENILPLVEVA